MPRLTLPALALAAALACPPTDGGFFDNSVITVVVCHVPGSCPVQPGGPT